MKQDPAFAGDVLGEQDVGIAVVPGEQAAPHRVADGNAVGAVVGGIDVVLALGIVELGRAALDDRIALFGLAEIEARLADGGTAGGERRDVLQVEQRQAFAALARHRRHHHAGAVGEEQMQVDPGLRVGRQQRRLELARRQHHLLIGAVQPIAVDVHVEEFVIGPDLLELGVGVHQRLPVPQPDVVDGRAVGLERGEAQPFLGRERLHRDLLQVVGLPRQGDVALDIGRLELQLARLHGEAIEQRGKQPGDHDRAGEQQQRRRRGEAPGPPPHGRRRGDGAGGGQSGHEPQDRQPDMEIGVARADDDAVVAVEQQEAIERVGPGLDREVQAEQHRAVDEGGGRQAARRPVELDVALHPIDRAGQGGAEEQEQQQPVLERDIGRQREEIEADVLAEDRVALAIGHLVKEAKGHLPVRELDRSGQQAEQDRCARDKKAARDMRRHVTDELHRRLRCPRGKGRACRPGRRLPGEAERQRLPTARRRRSTRRRRRGRGRCGR